MSQENVDIVRAAVEAFADRGLEAYAEFLHPDAHWRAMEGALDDVGEMSGLDAIRRYVQDWIDTFDEFSVEVVELQDLSSDQVLAVQHLTGRAKLSGLETALRYVVIYTLRDGLIVDGREYVDREQALKAVGLDPGPARGAG
jgi:ketosteroid isomerase-like protein